MKKIIKTILFCIPMIVGIICYGKMLSVADSNMEKLFENVPAETERYSAWQDERYIICEVDHFQDDWVVNSNDTILHIVMPDGSIQMYGVETTISEPTEVLFLPNDSYAKYEIIDIR